MDITLDCEIPPVANVSGLWNRLFLVNVESAGCRFHTSFHSQISFYSAQNQLSFCTGSTQQHEQENLWANQKAQTEAIVGAEDRKMVGSGCWAEIKLATYCSWNWNFLQPIAPLHHLHCTSRNTAHLADCTICTLHLAVLEFVVWCKLLPARRNQQHCKSAISTGPTFCTAPAQNLHQHSNLLPCWLHQMGTIKLADCTQWLLGICTNYLAYCKTYGPAQRLTNF